MKTILIGFGDIAEKHLSVLQELKCEVLGVVGRNYEKTLEKSKKFKISNVFNDLENLPFEQCDFLMNLTSVDMIPSTLKKIISFKKPIFTEKPVGFGTDEIQELIEQNKNFNTPIMVGTNRRFYSIFHKAIRFLKENDRTVESIIIDAPERFSDINKEKFNEKIIKNWMFANSIHCVDLIRFFCGDVRNVQSDSVPKELNFKATGVCENGVNFSYSSNWKESGSWKIAINASDLEIVFEPIEKGRIIFKNKKFEIIPSEEDTKFKPGFHAQLSHFLDNFVLNHHNKWPASDLNDHKKSLKLVEDIFLTK